MSVKYRKGGKVYAMFAGATVTVENVPANSTKTVSVTFPTPFEKTPNAFAVIIGDLSIAYADITASAFEVTPTGCKLKVVNGTVGVANPPVKWIAIMN